VSVGERFVFRLGRLLSLRERHEEEQAVALAAALERCDLLRRERDGIAERRHAARARVLPTAGGAAAAGDGLAMQQFVDLADARIAALGEELAAAEADAAAKRAALAAAMAERRALERLREKQRDDWRVETDRRARTAMDDVALRIVMEQRTGRTD
jgi:flagellar export protein FliJ